MDSNIKESRQARIERTLAGTGELYKVGKLLAKTKDSCTLAQMLVQGEEIGPERLGFPHPLPEQFSLSLRSISLWGCPFCGTAHGSGFGLSRTVNVVSLENNEFYYNPLTRQLFTISSTCLRKQTGLSERFVNDPATQKIEVPLFASAPVISSKQNVSKASEAAWVRKSVAFVFAFYCGLVVYSHSLWRNKGNLGHQEL